MHEKCVLTEPTTFVSMFAAHHATNLRHEGCANWLGIYVVPLNYLPCVIVCVRFGWLVAPATYSTQTEFLQLAIGVFNGL